MRILFFDYYRVIEGIESENGCGFGCNLDMCVQGFISCGHRFFVIAGVRHRCDDRTIIQIINLKFLKLIFLNFLHV